MPVVTVLAPPHPAVEELLFRVADAVATALDLGPGDVVAVHSPAGSFAVSGQATAETDEGSGPWSVVSIQGRRRTEEKMEAARSDASAALTAWADDHGVAMGGVWTQWVTPLP